MRVVDDVHQAAVTHERAAAAGDEIRALIALDRVELAGEGALRPRFGVRHLLDGQDLRQVAAEHPLDRQHAGLVAIAAQQAREHAHLEADSRVDQLICASGARRYSGWTSHGLTHSSRSARAWASCTSGAADGWARN